MSIEKLNEKALVYELPQDELQERENHRLSFIEKFPLAQLGHLSIDQYAQGTDENSFCYWLEFKKIGFGIGGGNASKFGIYKTKTDSAQCYAIGYGKNKTLLEQQEAQVFFKTLISSITAALNYTQNDEIDKIRALDIPMWNMVIQKILTMYYPDKFLTIGSSDVLLKCANELKLEGIELTSENSIQVNYACKKALDTSPAMKNWSYEKTGTFIWDFYNGEELKRNRKNMTKYWLYAPGEDATKWDEFYASGIMGLGWDAIGDLNLLTDRESIKNELKSKYNYKQNPSNNSLANFEFRDVISIGDIVIAKRGRQEYLGYGIVTSDYFYDDNRDTYQKCRKVDWKTNGIWIDNDGEIVLKTLTDITKYPTYVTRLVKLLGIEDNTTIEKPKTPNIVKMHPLNTILYGPPGTGKTYHSIMRAAEIIENRTIASYSEALAIFKANLHDRIEFITFHQNYSYEDFIQGLRPNTENEGQLTFKKIDGVFKRIADRARGESDLIERISQNEETVVPQYCEYVNPEIISDELKKSNIHLGEIASKLENNWKKIKGLRSLLQEIESQGEFENVYTIEKIPNEINKIIAVKEKFQQEHQDEFKSALRKNEIEEFSVALSQFIDFVKKGGNKWVHKLNDKVTITGVDADGFRYNADAWTSKTSDFTMKFSDLTEFFSNDVKKRKDIKTLENISGLAKQHATYYFLAYTHILDYLPEKIELYWVVEPEEYELEISQVSYSRDILRNIFEKISPSVKDDSKGEVINLPNKIDNQHDKNYVIIIDEINRANISRVFGELITLIEPDKRSQGAIPLEVKLPSGDKFAVPSNLYIIGTMNTADKSIALLDIALRRRFEFEPMYPKYEIEGKVIYDAAILEKLNIKIKETKGHDFQIGHAYFMDESTNLVERMNKKVIPLLLEYYMNDEKEVKQILNYAGLKTIDNSWPLRIE